MKPRMGAEKDCRLCGGIRNYVKRTAGGFLGTVCILGMLTPLQASAAEQDMVTLMQEESRVSVSVTMTDSLEEDITAVSLALHVEVIGKGDEEDIQVAFTFDQQLANTEHDTRYHDGVLEIYAASAKALFPASGQLSLGKLEVTPKDPSDTMRVQISYEADSFRTANSSYGSKKPEVARVSPAIDMQIGLNAVNSVSTQTLEDYLEQARNCNRDQYTQEQWEKLQEAIEKAEKLLWDSGVTQAEIEEIQALLYQAMQNKHTEENTDVSNRDQGLYDETTEFVNHPSDAKKISSPVVKPEEQVKPQVDLSQGLPAIIAGTAPGAGMGGSETGGSQTGQNVPVNRGSVSVISPSDGPSGILINQEGDVSSMAVGGDKTSESAMVQTGQESQEILLDQEKGGVVSREKHLFQNGVPIVVWGAPAIVLAAILGGIFLLKNRNQKSRSRRKKTQRQADRKKQPDKSVGKTGKGTGSKTGRKR